MEVPDASMESSKMHFSSLDSLVEGFPIGIV